MALNYASLTNVKSAPLEVYQRNANQCGYGDKIRCDHMVQIEGSARWFRVYAICHSNTASLYILTKGERQFIRNLDITHGA